jgi:TRAP-type C4-dicarboxylate transport system permease small subunit
LSATVPSGRDAGPRRYFKRASEVAGALLLAAMFGAFLLQVFMRYLVNRPLEWTLEVCLIASLAFLLNERERVAFGLIYDQVAPPARRVLAVISAALIAALFVAVLPGTYGFVSFMALDSTWVLHLRFDLVFSVFLLLMVAVIVRAFRQLGSLLRRNWPEYL